MSRLSRAVQGWPFGLALAASLSGLAFALSSTLDYASHLDRQIHDIHCSFIPGLGAEQAENTGCRTAMYSPFAALFRDKYWGGVPISLFAVGAFAFFAAFALYLLLARTTAPRRASQFLFGVSLTPFAVSVLMFIIALTRLGHLCKTCGGIYISSALLVVAGIAALIDDIREAQRAVLAAVRSPSREVFGSDKNAKADAGAPAIAPTIESDGSAPATPAAAPTAEMIEPAIRRTGGPLLIPAWLGGLGLFSITPALLYIAAIPSYATYITSCGKLENLTEPNGALLKIKPAGAKQPATILVDPLCPTCKGLHQRLVTEGVFDKLDTTLVLFPLDSDCNWMLDRPLHPGACVVSKAILCSEHRALSMLEWSYDNQEEILAAAKAGAGINNVRAMIRERFPGLDVCIDSKETTLRLNRMLRYIVNNHLPVSTPQMFLGNTRVCDEDTDIGLAYTLRKLAPELGSQ